MTALLKEQIQDRKSIHAQRIDRAHWAGVTAELRQILSSKNAFKRWEVDAIIESLTDMVSSGQRLTVEALSSRLHSRQFSLEEARAISGAIVKAYG